jgi:ubiquinone biosynthesis protein UbiJ
MDQELVQYLDRRFETLDQRFQTLEQGINQRFQIVDQRFQTLEQGIDRRFDETNERIDEVKRHGGVLVEGLRHEVQLLAEGFATFIDVRYAQDQANIDRRFNETNALIRSSYDHLRQRVENLERKGQA